MIANLLDDELKHLPTACSLTIELRNSQDFAGEPGFDPEVLQHLFERRVKGRDSNGHRLGLAFVDAVVRAHGGTVAASNREIGGAQIMITIPLAFETDSHPNAGHCEIELNEKTVLNSMRRRGGCCDWSFVDEPQEYGSAAVAGHINFTPQVDFARPYFRFHCWLHRPCLRGLAPPACTNPKHKTRIKCAKEILGFQQTDGALGSKCSIHAESISPTPTPLLGCADCRLRVE